MRSATALDLKQTEVLQPLRGTPTFAVGSAFAGLGYEDIDIFVPSQPVLFTTVQHMLDKGWVLDDRYDRVWHRWLRYGLKNWHTNSIKLFTLNDVQVNVVYKIVDGHPTTTLSQVLESFDFGLLAQGWNMETNTFHDLKPYLFPELWQDYESAQVPVGDRQWPLMPDKQRNWVRGFVSQYNGLREGYRYAKYHGYGHRMDLVKPDLVTGYRAAALYHANQFDDEKKILAEIYGVIADRIERDEVDELIESYKVLDFNDPLDEIMEALV